MVVAVSGSGNEGGGDSSNGHHQIEDQQMPINLFSDGQAGLCSDIINQYGQLIGEYSRLDDELWFSKPQDDDDDDDDDNDVDAMARTQEGLGFNFTPSHEQTVHQEQMSKSIDNPVSDGSTTCVKEASSSLKVTSLDQSQSSSPVSVLRRKSYSRVTKKATKCARSENGRFVKCNSPDGLKSLGSTFSGMEQSQTFQWESYMESSQLDGTAESEPVKQLRTKKVSDLLLSGSGDNQEHQPHTLESHLGQGVEEPSSWVREQDPNLKLTQKMNQAKMAVKKCMHCESTKTPQWREGPMGQGTLCNACGVQYKKGRLFPEYRPLKSPKFNPCLHSNSKPTSKRKQPKIAVKKCLRCGSTETPQWREGPMGQGTLWNACGVQYKNGKLSPECCPLKSTTFNPSLHFNPKPASKMKRPKMAVKKCVHCDSTETPLWIEGPMGQGNPSNVCGVHYKNGKLFSESSPLECLPFNPSLHSNPKPAPKWKQPKIAVKKCMHCESTKTPQWREGPMGQGTLCNACGVQYRNGRLFPEYRPLKSPTFNPSLHSNLPKKVQQMRMNRNTLKSAVSGDSEQPAIPSSGCFGDAENK